MRTTTTIHIQQRDEEGHTAMTAQHTPGPWRTMDTKHSGRVAIHDSAGRWVADAINASGGRAYSTERWDEAEANARLIAAAPAMLAALEMTEAFISEHEAWWTEGVEADSLEHDILRWMRAAIALARGEA